MPRRWWQARRTLKSTPPLHPRSVLAGIAILWLGITTLLVWLGVADGELISDDAYYYFEISRNAARGDGFTFDGLHPTNGFHPLWAWLLVPVFVLFPTSAWTPIHVALTLSALCVVATAACIFVAFDRHARPDAGLVAATLWLFNPFTLVLSSRGLEGPLNVLLITIAYLTIDAIRTRQTYTAREALALGGVLGLCLLARTDNVLLVAAFGIILFVDLVRRGYAPAVIAKRGVLLLLTALVIVSPWIAWNLSTFGTVVQTSLRAKAMFDLYGRLPPLGEGLGTAAGMVRNLGLVATSTAKYVAGEEWVAMDRGWNVLVVTLLVGAVAGLLAVVFRSNRKSGPGLGPLALFSALHLAWYAWISRSYYNWYFLPLVLVFCLYAGDGFGRAWASKRVPARLLLVALIVAGLALSTRSIAARHVEGWEPRRSEREFLRSSAAERLSTLPSDARAGLWNAGRVGYFASFHYPARVINLDGVVNNEIVRHTLGDTYESYILENIEWLLENPNELRKYVDEQRALRFIRDHIDREGKVVQVGGEP